MTLPANVPAAFRAAAHKFAADLKAAFASPLAAQPEDQLKGPVRALIESVLPHVFTKTEVQVDDLGGRPDIGVMVKKAVCGHVELKAPGHGAVTRRFKGRDKAQWEKFKALPNLLYTDACEWALYRSGESYPDDAPLVVRFPDLIEQGSAALDDATLAALHTLLVEFLNWEPIVPSQPRALAQLLAPLCRLLRTEVATVVGREDSALRHLSGDIRDYLFPTASDEDFADIYAQTLTYSLLLARISGETDLTAAHAADRLDSGHGLLATTLRILTDPAARAEVELPVALLERVIAKVDPVKFSKRGDPWLYFYEDFLAAYDPALRRKHGVYYTPQQVISCQVHLVAALLADRFDKPLTFADDGVVFLDSSAGTGAYPLAAIHDALARVESTLGPGAVESHATRCAENVYAFEQLVGPYAVAHLRLTQLFLAHKATLPKDGLHVLLTDTLESPHVDPPQPPLFLSRLTTEQKRARKVKARVPVFVCMGNPPYFREENDASGSAAAHTRGKWVRFGDEDAKPANGILQDFVAGAGGHAKNLYNLYVYFWRWTLWKMFEQPDATRQGIVSFITASSYLRGPGFVSMRRHMREAFDELWIIDLEGGGLGARKTENVFAIQTPVCIATGIRHGEKKRHALARVRYTRITGTREQKLEKLAAVRSFADLNWQDCFAEPEKPLLPIQSGDYFGWPLVTDLWPWQHSGSEIKRSWPIGETKEILESRWSALVSTSLEERATALFETRDRKAEKRYNDHIAEHPLPTLSSLSPNNPAPTPSRYAFRSLDRRWLLADNRVADYLRPVLWKTHGTQQVFITSMLTDVLGEGASAMASAYVPDRHHLCGRGGKDVIPLWRDAAATQPNLPAGLLAALAAGLAPQPAPAAAPTAEDFFAYTYALLAAPGYVATFAEELTIPGPRLPVTRDAALFARAVALGRRLLWLHTYGERFVPAGQKPGRIPGGLAKCLKAIPGSAEGYPEDFSYTPGATPDAGVLRVGTGEFGPVSTAVWEFSVSGYEVVKGWLGFRMKERSGKKSSPLDDIRPAAWTATLTQELLELLWVLEATVNEQPAADSLLAEIIAGPLFVAADLPSPNPEEREAPDTPTTANQGELTL